MSPSPGRAAAAAERARRRRRRRPEGRLKVGVGLRAAAGRRVRWPRGGAVRCGWGRGRAAAPFPPPCGRGHGGRGCPLPERSPVSGGAVREEPSRPRGAAGGRMSFAVTAAGWRLPTGPASAKSAEVLQLNWVPAGPRRRLPAGHSALLCSRRAGRHGDRYRRLLLPARPQAPRNLQHLLWKK